MAIENRIGRSTSDLLKGDWEELSLFVISE